MIYGWDWDGTLVESFGPAPLPGAREAIRPYRAGVLTFVATNQSGPVFRAVLGSAKYPTVEQVCTNIGAGIAALSFRPDLFVLCCHPGKDGEEWAAAALDVGEQFHRQIGAALQAIDYAVFFGLPFRKPQPGMLAYAAGYFKAQTAEIVYVGDMESDEIAARQCGARFVDAAEWLGGAAL